VSSESPFQQVSVAGVSLELIRMGQGRPLLYLHDGGGIEASLPFITALAGDFEVHAPSHPGFGGSDLPAGFSLVDDIAYLYLDYIEQHDLRDVVLAGVSFGGGIAAEMAVKASPRIGALALIDAVGVKFSDREHRDLADIFYLLPEQIRDLGYHRVPPRAPVTSIEAARRIARNRETLSLYGWSPLLHNPKLRGRLHRVTAPTLVLWGASDQIAPVAYGRSYAAAIKGAQFELIEEAGHLPQAERPDIVAERLVAFAAPVPARRPA
jgi:pimeloyl-ACP methyl ester carboxylesterase